MPIAAEEDDARAHLVGLHAVAVELQLLDPAFAGSTALAGTGLQGGMKRSSDTVTVCGGTALAGQLGLVAFRLVRIAARCCNEPDGQHARCQPRRPSRRHALAVGHLRAVPASHRQRHLRHGSSDGVLMRRAICCDAQPDARNAVARARRSKSQAGADFRPQYVGGHPSLRVADDMISAASCDANPVRRAQRNSSLAFCPSKGAQ
jgi:hypothetical protein